MQMMPNIVRDCGERRVLEVSEDEQRDAGEGDGDRGGIVDRRAAVVRASRAPCAEHQVAAEYADRDEEQVVKVRPQPERRDRHGRHRDDEDRAPAPVPRPSFARDHRERRDHQRRRSGGDVNQEQGADHQGRIGVRHRNAPIGQSRQSTMERSATKPSRQAKSVELNSTAASLLGFLHEKPCSGYDLEVVIDGSIGRFWNVTRSQIYRELQEARRRPDRCPRASRGARLVASTA